MIRKKKVVCETPPDENHCLIDLYCSSPTVRFALTDVRSAKPRANESDSDHHDFMPPAQDRNRNFVGWICCIICLFFLEDLTLAKRLLRVNDATTPA